MRAAAFVSSPIHLLSPRRKAADVCDGDVHLFVCSFAYRGIYEGCHSRPPICNLKKNGWLKKNRLIFGLAELSRKLKKSADYKNFAAKIRLITNNFG